MTKRILSVVAGLITGFVLIMLVETVSHKMYPPPPGFDFNNKDALKELMDHAPKGALLMVIAAWAFGAFGGGLVASLVSKHSSPLPPLIVGIVLMLAGVGDLLMIPHPLWMFAGLIVFIPLAWMGHQSAVKIQHE